MNAKFYASRAKILFDGFKELAANPTTAEEAKAGLAALEALMGRIGRVGKDLLNYHPTLGRAYRAIFEPVLQIQIAWLEARLAFLRGAS